MAGLRIIKPLIVYLHFSKSITGTFGLLLRDSITYYKIGFGLFFFLS